MRATLFLVLTLVTQSLLLWNCRGDQGPAGLADKQIRLELLGSLVTDDTTFHTPESYAMLIKFNVDYYPGITSMVFVSSLSSDSGNTAIVDLFDATDGVSIHGSELKGSSVNPIWVESGNILDRVPHKEITIIARLRSSQYGKQAVKYDSYVFLYR